MLLGLASAAVSAAPTLIVNVNGYTLAGDQLSRFSGMLFDSGKVVETGDSPLLRQHHPDAHVIDGHGRTLLPGLIDAHGHLLDLGLEAVQIQLSGTRSLRDAQAKIRAYAGAHPRLSWLLGDGWNQVAWRLGRFPVARELDAAVADRPVVLDRIDHHAKWLNSKALRAAGITRRTPDPPGGRIERDPAGNPSGVLVDNAMRLVEPVIPQPTEDEQRAAFSAAFSQLNSLGLTGVGDAGDSAQEIAIYKDMADQGRLTVRVYAMIWGNRPDFAQLSKSGPLIGYSDDMLTVRAVKLLADGALGSRGAALIEPYSDAPDQRGLLFMSDSELQDKIEMALRAGYQVNIHAIGDAANHQVLDAFEAAYRDVSGRKLRNRVEHAQVVSPADIPRFKELDLIASMQPTHATSDMSMAETRIGPERLKGAYAWRTFLDQGTRIAGGSDFPVESPNPFFGLHAAVTRTDHSGSPQGGWHPEQAMTLLEAFRAFTLDAAYAEHQETMIGSLEPGKWADFILIDRDLFAIPPGDIWKIKVEQTWLAGRQVY
jgi:predicted amidohydrolase YtcJ